MPKRIVKTSGSQDEYRFGKHRFEHWHIDNQVYFITARCHGRFRAFADECSKVIFWDRFDHYTEAHGFVPWVTSLMDNHYHTIGYLRVGSELPRMMQRIHGSVAKMVNDQLRAQGVRAPWLSPPADGASAPGSKSVRAHNEPKAPRAQARSAKKFWGDRVGPRILRRVSTIREARPTHLPLCLDPVQTPRHLRGLSRLPAHADQH